MRLWSLHPKYLDSKGLVALWREGLLALKVLKGKTKRYKNHPQLERFRKQPDPVSSIEHYLFYVYEESKKRGFKFNLKKIKPKFINHKIEVTDKQLIYELEHLKRKLEVRDLQKYMELEMIRSPKPNPIFKVVKGPVETWETSYKT